MDTVDINDIDDVEDLEVLGVPRGSNTTRQRTNPFSLGDDELKKKYRFTKDYANRIINMVRDAIKRDPRGCPISSEQQVLCALRCWARHEIQDDAGELHGISQPAVSIICKRVATALAYMSHLFIKMPATIEEQRDTMAKFRAIANFPTVIGAIDCTHVKIKKVAADGGQVYINRKGFSSVNVQVVCDADLRIRDIVTRWNGSVHDSRIFRESRLKQRFEAGAFSGLLLGDGGYPCTPYLFTPLRNPKAASSPQEQRYNRAHILTHNTMRDERCFGVLKQRFRGLLRGMFGNIDTAKKTIVACSVLHNIAIDMKEEIVESSDDSDSDDASSSSSSVQFDELSPGQLNIFSVRGDLRRRQFIERNF